MNIRTSTIRLFPDKCQVKQLNNLFLLRNMIWNNLISIKEEQYKSSKKSLSDFDLMLFLPKLKEQYPELKNFNSKAAQTIAKQIGAAYRSFFTSQKNGDTKSRPPRQIDLNKITSITFNQSGWNFSNNKLKLSKIKSLIPFKSKNNIEQLNIKEIRIKLKNNKWLIDIVEEYPNSYIQNNSNAVLAIDLGLKTLATGIDNTGKIIHIPNKAKKISKYFGKQIAEIDKKLARKQENSNRTNKLIQKRRKLFKKKNAQVKQTLHIQSNKLRDMNYHTIVLGDLSVKQLMSTETNKKKGVRKSLHNSSINTFRTYLTYKCNGRTNVVEIDERHTTQINCLTGKKFKNKIELKDRQVEVAKGIIIDRDLNSAINILRRWESYHIAALIPPLDKEKLFDVLVQQSEKTLSS